MKLPTLFHKAKGGELRQWSVWTDGPDIITEYGQVNGQLQQSRKTAISKNVGRSNETSSEEQAELEAKSLWQYKIDRKYSLTPKEAQEPLNLPMLAHSFSGTKRSKFVFPADLQPKLDGIRCLAQRDENGKIMLTSRQGKPWNIPHIEQELDRTLLPGTILDGEIYVHGESCQRITSLVRSADPTAKSYKPESIGLEYWIYDVPCYKYDDSLTWDDRKDHLSSIKGTLVPTVRVENEKSMWEQYSEFVRLGYEGAILRALHGKYLWGYRSSELLKVKEFQDSEFKVVGANQGIGKMVGCVIFTCQNNLTSDTFQCTMKVSMAERRQMFTKRSQYIGKMLTVRFFDRTEDKIPRFPVGVVFRDEND